MNWKCPSVTQFADYIINFCLCQIFSIAIMYIMTQSLSVDTFLQDVHRPTLVTRQRKRCVCICGMSHRPCAPTAVFDDVYILMGSVQGLETKAVSKNEPSLKQ